MRPASESMSRQPVSYPNAFVVLIVLCALIVPSVALADDDKTLSSTDEQIATFYLENGSVKDVMTKLRSLLAAKNIAADESQNAITLRDTAAKVALATELVRLHDVPTAETTVDVLVLELPSAVVDGLRQRLSGELRLTAEEALELRQSDGAKRLAQPRLHARAGEKAQVTIGDRMALGSQDGVPQYQDVGLDIQMRPTVHREQREVTVSLDLALSHLVPGGHILPGDRRAFPTVATREARTSLRLGTGESVVLPGFPAYNPRHEAGTAASAAPLEEREIVFVVSAAIVRTPELTARHHEPLSLGRTSFSEPAPRDAAHREKLAPSP